MKATLKLKLLPSPDQFRALGETMNDYTQAFNRAASIGWREGTCDGVRLHKITYRDIRSEFPLLPSQLVISSRRKACEALKSARDRKRKGRKVSCPRSSSASVRYDARSYRADLFGGTCSLATVQGRIKVSLKIAAWHRPYLDWNVHSADLVADPRKKRFYLHVVVETESPDVPPTGKVVGVDLGIRRIAVTSEPMFFNSKHLHAVVSRHRRLRRALQAKGTASALRHLRRMGRKWSRFQADVNHVVSRRIADGAGPGDVVALEDLKGIRERCRHRKDQRGVFHNWAFAQLQAFVACKAERKGVTVVHVDPRYTSLSCPKCSFRDDNNRVSQSEFRCRVCGYRLNADCVGAVNVRQRGMSLLPGLSVNQPVATPVEVEGPPSAWPLETEGSCKPATPVAGR